MLKSMTGFGRSLLDASFGKLIVEIQSVNRKFLDISLSLPKEYSRFEFEIRKWIGETLSRGQISVRIFVIPNVEGLLPDFNHLSMIKQKWEEMAKKLGYNPNCIDLSFLLNRLPHLTQIEMAEDSDLHPFKKAVDDALLSLIEMKKKEGRALSEDIRSRLLNIEKALDIVEELSKDVTLRMKEKLKERIFEVFSTTEGNDERLLREIAIFAEKVDISEEITRLRSHIVQFYHLIKETAASGRKMEFLVQELGREINTIGSKCSESKISHLTLEMKSELEKIREQIQNVE